MNSGSKLSIPRPDFGLEIHNSPKPKPVTLVTAADVLEVELFFVLIILMSSLAKYLHCIP